MVSELFALCVVFICYISLLYLLVLEGNFVYFLSDCPSSLGSLDSFYSRTALSSLIFSILRLEGQLLLPTSQLFKIA